MTASPWTPTTAGYARNVAAEPVALLLRPTTECGPWRTLYRDGEVWHEGTKGDDVIAAARAMNARLRSMGVECGDEVPWGAVGEWMVGAPSPAPFAGRRKGQACGCGGVLTSTHHEHVASPGWTLDCDTCDASYREDGAHWCPKCETWPDRWVGGTDSDPRPWCCKCGGDQPGWPRRVPTERAGC